MLSEICAYLHNYFTHDADGNPYHVERGEFNIENGSISAPFLTSGQHYRIEGSLFNDGVHVYGESPSTLTDERFNGAIWAMRVSPAFIALSDEIAEWQTKNGAAAASPFTSESFGGYSYSKSSGSGGDASWITAFRSRLNAWRKI